MHTATVRNPLDRNSMYGQLNECKSLRVRSRVGETPARNALGFFFLSRQPLFILKEEDDLPSAIDSVLWEQRSVLYRGRVW